MESSGLALSGVHDGVLWTINDSGGGALLFAIDTTGTLLSTIRVAGAQNRDWEDLAQAPCAEGSCLYIADVGDNFERRGHGTIYRIPEPALSDSISAPAEPLRFSYPDRPRNVEAVAVSPAGSAYIIAKWGDNAMYSLPVTGGESVLQATKLLELRVNEEITGASFTPDGRWLVIRSYRVMRFIRPREDGTLEWVGDPAGVDLRPLQEPAGEAVAVRSDGTVFLTSEGTARRRPMFSRVNCSVP